MDKEEQSVNKFLYKVFKYSLILIFLNYLSVIIKYKGIPLTPEKIIFFSIWLVVVMTLILYKYKSEKGKYLFVLSSLLVCFMFYMTSGLTALLLWVFPINAASLYADPKLVKRTYILSIPLLIIGHLMQAVLYPDNIIQNTFSTAVYFTTFFVLEFLALGFISVRSSSKTHDMLMSSVKMNESTRQLLDQSMQSSEKLSHDVELLYSNIKQSKETSEGLSDSIGNIARDSEAFKDNISFTDKSVEAMAATIDKNYSRIKEMLIQTNQMSEMALSNKSNLLKTVEDIEQIKNYTSQSVQAVQMLVEKVKEIQTASSVINNISKQTDLLALNASIEAARAGESGRGFSVVAEEIKKLAAQSEKSSGDIQDIIQSISEDINYTVESIEQTSGIVKTNIESIKTTANDFDQMFEMQKDVMVNIKDYSKLMDDLNDSGNHIKETMSDLNDTNVSNYSNITEISSSIKGLDDRINEISQYVSNINEEAKALGKSS